MTRNARVSHLGGWYYVSNKEFKDGKRIIPGETFHTDHSNHPASPKATMLYTVSLPSRGGKATAGSALPAKIGQCATTQIAEVTTRPDVGRPPKPEDFDTGTAAGYRDTGYQVS